MKQSAFTVIELMVVVAVIAILGTIIVYGYRGAQDEAKDTRRRAAVQQVEQAIKALKMRRDDTLLMGGFMSTIPPEADSNGFCRHNASGTLTSATGANYVFYSGTSSNYTCTTGSMLINTGMLPRDFASQLIENEEYTASADRRKDAAMVIYRCDTTNTRWILYYYVKTPTAAETASLGEAFTSCQSITSTLNTQLTSTLKMRAAVDIRI